MAHPRSRIVALVIGCLLLLPALGLLAAGAALGIVTATQRDNDGYFEVTLDPVTTSTVAVTARDLGFAAEPGSPDWVIDWFDADVRLRVSGANPDRAVFVGIARTADVDRYLADVAHVRVVELDGRRPVYEDEPGTTRIVAPITQDFWVADAVGTDTLQVDWEAAAGRWSVVVMNADGSPDVDADVEVGIRVGVLVPITVALLAAGAVLTVVAVVLVVVGASRPTGREPAPVGSGRPGATPGGGEVLPPPMSPILPPPPVEAVGRDPSATEPDVETSAPSPELQEVHR